MKSQWKLRTFSLVLILTLMVSAGMTTRGMASLVQAQPAAIPAEAAEGTNNLAGRFAGGSGTAEDPYLVATAAQLDNVRNHMEAHFLQVADINLGEAPYNGGQGWWPIGAPTAETSLVRFTGSYDGGGYVIRNLTIYPVDQYQSPPGHRYIGLFAYVDGAILQNIFMEKIDVGATFSTGSWYIGGLAGYAKSSILDNVHVIGEDNRVTVTYGQSGTTPYARIGGLIGTNSSDGYIGLQNRGLIHNASSNAAVEAIRVSYVGGLVGVNYGTIRHSHSSGTVIGGDRVGGLVGHNDNVISDSYSHASVSGRNRVGGLVGITWSASTHAVHRSFSTGRVSGDEDVGGLMGQADTALSQFSNCYWDVETSGQATSAGGSDVVGLTTAAMQQQATYRYFNFNTLWQIDEGRDYPAFQELAAYALPLPVNLTDLAGSGSEEDPYILTNADELNAMHQDLSASYRLGNDIDLSASVAWNHGRGWMAVGSGTTNPFVGSLDGGGFTIYNLTMNRPRQRPVNYYQGLFGYTHEASFKNIRLEDVNIQCYRTCGALAGRIAYGQVEDIAVNGIVLSTDDQVGGVIGSSYNRTNFKNIFAEVDVLGRNRTGGIVGNMSSSVLYSASVLGSVQGADRMGGLVGYASNSEIYDSFSRASVSGHDEVGGLVGYFWINDIERAYSTGLVSGTGNHVGGLVGRNPRLENDSTEGLAGLLVRDDGGVSDSYWDTETSGQGTSAGGLGRTTDEMTYPYAANTYEGWDFVHTWGADSAYLYNAGYPYLRAAVLVDPVPLDFEIFLPLIVR